MGLSEKIADAESSDWLREGMTNEEAREIMLTEWECVDRQDTPKCDRDCRHCDLVMDSELVREAYRMAIKALEQEQKTGHWIDTGSGQDPKEGKHGRT